MTVQLGDNDGTDVYFAFERTSLFKFMFFFIKIRLLNQIFICIFLFINKRLVYLFLAGLTDWCVHDENDIVWRLFFVVLANKMWFDFGLKTKMMMYHFCILFLPQRSTLEASPRREHRPACDDRSCRRWWSRTFPPWTCPHPRKR